MELLSTMPTAQRTEILSTYDQAIQEGLIKGRQEGRQEGKEENLVEVVVRCWNNKLELDLIARITKLTVDQVKAILVSKQLI